MKSTFGTGYLAEVVGVSKSALQRYITILENNGYEIRRDHRNYRTFNEEDIAYFQAYTKLHKNRGMSLREAAEVVTSPDFDVAEVEVIPTTKQVVMKNNFDVDRYNDLSNAMELLAEHVKNIEEQNAQLMQFIQAQQQQHALLVQQNEQLTSEFNSIRLQIDAPKTETTVTKNQLDRLEAQNSAIMANLNRINADQHRQEIQQKEVQQENAKGLFKKIFQK